jgi:hypothetical protein
MKTKISQSKVSVLLVRQELNNRFLFMHLIGRKIVSSGYCRDWLRSGTIVELDVTPCGAVEERTHIYDVEEVVLR